MCSSDLVDTYDFYTGVMTSVRAIGASPPFRTSPVIVAFPQNQLLMVLGGLQLKDSDKRDQHMWQRVDVFRAENRQWERWPPLPAMEGTLFHSPKETQVGSQRSYHSNMDAIKLPHSPKHTGQDEFLLVLGAPELFAEKDRKDDSEGRDEKSVSHSRPARLLTVGTQTWSEQFVLPRQPLQMATIVALPFDPDVLVAVGGLEIDRHDQTVASTQVWVHRMYSPQRNAAEARAYLDGTPREEIKGGLPEIGSRPMDEWIKLKPMRHYRERPQVCFIDNGNKMLVYGGCAYTLSVTAIECYNFDTAKWSLWPALPQRYRSPQEDADMAAELAAGNLKPAYKPGRNAMIPDHSKPTLLPIAGETLECPPLGFSLSTHPTGNSDEWNEWSCRVLSPEFELNPASYVKLLHSVVISL